MSHCPSPGELQRLLAEQLSGPEHETVEAHVETCDTCQEQLELLVGNPVATVSQRQSGRLTEPAHEPADEFLRRLRQSSPPHLASGQGRTTPPPAPQEPGSTRLPAQDAKDQPGLGRLGQYQLLEKLGVGGLGAVYKARHCELEKIVALKVLPAELMNELTVARFKNEMKAVGKLEHPNIVGAHDAGQVNGTHFLVMDFVDGIDLARLVDRSGGLRVPDACELIRQAAAGLHHAYERGLAHRDIKPSNLMLARNGLVKVLDLGLARSLGDAPLTEKLTATGLIIGTADYIAPEQWEAARTADIRADIYSLGCTLYHLLAGTPPFGDARYSSWLKKMRAHVEAPVPPIQQYRPEVPGELAAVLDRMLAKNPAERFATPAAVAAALQPFTTSSDLSRLVEPGGLKAEAVKLATLHGPSADTPQPLQALQQTPPQARPRAYPPERVRRHYRLIAALAGCCLLLIAALVFWPERKNHPSPDENDTKPSTPVPVGEKPLQILAMRVDHYRGDPAALLGEMGRTSQSARLNDDVRVVVSLSVPAYCYLMALNPDGTVQLCHPEVEDGEKAAALSAAKSDTAFRYPQGANAYFGLNDGVGLQAFVLVAATKPLPPYSQWRSQIPWERVEAASATGVWRLDEGAEFIRLHPDRGTVRERGLKPLISLAKFFRGRPEFEAVQILAFPVLADAAAQRQVFSDDDTKQLEKLTQQFIERYQAGQYVEAQAPARAMLAIRERAQGATHWDTLTAQRTLETVVRIAALPAAAQDELTEATRIEKGLAELQRQSRYDEGRIC